MWLLSQTVGFDKQVHWTSLGKVNVLSSGLDPADDLEEDHLQVQNHDCTRVVGMFVVLDSVDIFTKIPIELFCLKSKKVLKFWKSTFWKSTDFNLEADF